MRNLLRILSALVGLLLMVECPVAAQGDWLKDGIHIKEIQVVGQRPMKEIGLQQTQIDSVALNENIALSMADLLTFNSSIFVKSYGRATLSTVAFRGTSASHTQVSWNGMKINNPMLGMTDFSMIPSYFIDQASLLHGTSSVNETGGGLGGAVKLSTQPAAADGLEMQYVQGVGSFSTYDEFLRLRYGADRWQLSTRLLYSSSENDFEYRNHDKKINVYDEQMNIVDQYYPIERNRSGAFNDLHLLQEVYYTTKQGDKLSLSGWYINSRRELPLITVDYGQEHAFENLQREETFRAVAGYDHLAHNHKLAAKAGYTHTWMAYDYKREIGNGTMASMTRSRSNINTLFGSAEGEWYVGSEWLFTGSLAAHQHFVLSRDKNIILQDGDRGVVGYDKARIELSGALSAKWCPTKRFGISTVVRQEFYGTKFSPLIPALFIDGVLSEVGNVVAKASVSRNFRYPSLNDLYFLPGGNPDLKHESGWSYDVGLAAATQSSAMALEGSLTWFDSYVDDWIIWLPTTKGFFSPRNLKSVHAYGVELSGSASIRLGAEWLLGVDGTYSWTPSINCGEPLTPADRSVGKQLPYVPEHSATLTGRLEWREWTMHYKWCYYSQRFTMSSNDVTLTGRLPDYYMNNISLERVFSLRWGDMSAKIAVNNLFDEEYLSVLSRPMPGINCELFLSFTPNFSR